MKKNRWWVPFAVLGLVLAASCFALGVTALSSNPGTGPGNRGYFMDPAKGWRTPQATRVYWGDFTSQP